MLSGLQAGAIGVPFLPVRGILGTDYLTVRPEFQVIQNPYDPPEPIVVVPAIRPDVAVFHALRADPAGNAIIRIGGNERMVAQAAHTVIITAEEIVERAEVRAPNEAAISWLYTDTVVLAPRGAHPGGVPGLYERDLAHLQAYLAAGASDERFAEYLARYITGAASEADYLERVGALAPVAPS